MSAAFEAGGLHRTGGPAVVEGFQSSGASSDPCRGAGF